MVCDDTGVLFAFQYQKGAIKTSPCENGEDLAINAFNTKKVRLKLIVMTTSACGSWRLSIPKRCD